MSELHRNIFYYCGLSKRSGSIKKQTPLENNVTKALLNTLDLCPGLRRRFLEWLRDRYDLTIDPMTFAYLAVLGNPDKDETSKDRVILLGIKKHRSDREGTPSGGTKYFDGKIVGEDWLIAIESKIGGMDKCQFKAQKDQITATQDEQILWKDVHGFFRELVELRGDELSECEKLFIQQFNDYLEIAGLIGFSGLDKERFAFFSRGLGEIHSAGEDPGTLMKALLGELWEYEYGDGERLSNLYWDHDTRINGLYTRQSDYAELRFYYRSKSSSPSVGVLIGVHDNSEPKQGYLEVYAHIEGETRLRRLAGFIGKRGGRGKLARRLRTAEFGRFRIGLYDKDWNTIAGHEHECGAITSEELNELSSTTRERADANAHFALARRFALVTSDDSCVTQLPADPKKQVDEIARAVRTVHPFVRFASGVTWEKIDWQYAKPAVH